MNMARARRAVPILVAGAATLSCGDGNTRSRDTGSNANADDLVPSKLVTIALGAADKMRSLPTCPGTMTQSADEEPDTLLVVGTRHLFSCATIGSMLRVRQGREGTEYAILAAESDLLYVCGFMSAEKIRLPVFGIESSEFDAAVSLGQALAIEVASGSWRFVDAAAEAAAAAEKGGTVPN